LREQKTVRISRLPAVLSISLLLIVSLFPASNVLSAGGDDTIVSVIPQSQTVFEGQTFTVNITVDPAEAIAGVQFDLTFDTSLLSAVGVTEGNLFDGHTSYFIGGTIDNENGAIEGVAGSMTPADGGITSKGTFATVEFTAKGIEKISSTSDIELSKVIVADPDVMPVAVIIENGSVEVEKEHTVADVIPSKESVSQNEVFTVDIDIIPSKGVAGIGFDFEFDPVLIKAVSVVQGDFFDKSHSQFKNGTIDNENGTIKDVHAFLTGQGNNVTSQGTFATIIFISNRVNGVSPLDLSSIRVWDTEAQSILAKAENGSIEVSVDYTIVSVEPSTQFASASAGQTFTVNITVDPAEAIAGVQFDLTFDSSILNAVGVTEGDLFDGHTSYFIGGTIDNENGAIAGVAGSMTPADGGITSKGTFATVEFTAKSVEGVSYINLSNVLIGAPDGMQVPATVENGDVETIFEYTFYLHQGWNLITMPIQNNFTAETLGQNISYCDTIAMWNTASQDYVNHPVGTAIADFEIEDGIGYFVHVSENTTFVISGKPIENISVSIEPGWNMIGWSFWNVTNAKGIGNSIDGCDTILGWNEVVQTYVGHPVGTNIHNFDVTTGEGLFIHATQESVWNGID